MPTFSSQMTPYSSAMGEHIARQIQSDHPLASASNKAEDKTVKPLIDKQLKRLESARVAQGTFSTVRTAILLASDASGALQDVLGTAVSAAAIGYASSVLLKENASTSGHITQAATGSLTIATTSLVRSAVNTLVNKSVLDERGAEEETYKKLKSITTPDYMASYPKDIQDSVKLLDDGLEKSIKFPSAAKGVVWFQQQLRHRELILLARPNETKPYTNFADPVLKKSFYAELEKLVKDYPSINETTIETLVQRIAANSQSDRPVRSQAYLYGPGGVGKTRLVRLIAKALGAPLVEINIPGKDINSLMGQRWEASYSSPTSPDSEVIGELPLKMIKAGFRNPIIFIDEVKLTSHNLNDLKLLLDPAKIDLKIGGYNANIDWSRATILIGSNDPLKDESMQTRLPQIIIREASDEAKIKVATSIVKDASEGYKKSLSLEQHKRLVSTCLTRLDELIELDNANFPGVRFLQNSTESLVHFVAIGLLKEAPRTMDNIREYLDIQYAQAKGRAMPGDPVADTAPPSPMSDD